MNELVVISGKGGTGKTSITASFATLAENAVLADCDVDAADLHLILEPEVRLNKPFFGGAGARIEAAECSACGTCAELCRFNAITQSDPKNVSDTATFCIDPIACEGCGVCAWFCPEQAIKIEPANDGEWFVSDTRFGTMVHAKLGIAAENSGKLVTTVRNQAKKIAEESSSDLILVDGPPGIGCPVIASITGASFLLIVSEPTVSGEHDLERVLSLANHFRVPAAVCINKYDINPEMAERIEVVARQAGALVLGRVRHDPKVTAAQIEGLSCVEYECAAGEDIKAIWKDLKVAAEEHSIQL